MEEDKAIEEPIHTEPTEQAPELSKNQKKKLQKLKNFEERKHLKRKAEKERRKLKNILAREQGLERTGPSRKELKKTVKNKTPADIVVAIDLSFDDLMSEKDLSSCAKQLLRIYTANRRGKKLIPLHFTSLSEDGKLFNHLQKHDGWKNWNLSVHKQSFLEIFDKEKIVYLTSDSDNVLTELEKEAVYVIGGLVDHNHHKSLTLDLAQKNTIRTARLPLSENLSLKSRSVLTINQVFDIILGVSDGNSWKDVLMQVIPQRKGIKLKEEAVNVKEIDTTGEGEMEAPVEEIEDLL